MTDYKNNEIGIACLGDIPFKQLFGYEPYDIFDPSRLDSRSLDNPQGFPDKELPFIPKLPYGDDIFEYFEEVAQKHFDAHNLDEKIDSLLTISRSEIKQLRGLIPLLIKETRAGVWTKLDINANLTELEDFDCASSVFDTESFVKGSECNSPIVAQAIGRDPSGVPCLYMWLHECFDEIKPYEPTKVSVGHNKLLVGHNFAFDRQKLAEAYTLDQPDNIYICTMAMMQLIAGVDEKQRWALNLDPRKNYTAQRIQEIGCKLGLVSCYEWLMKKSLPDDAKEPRNVFVKANDFSEFREKRELILEYSMLDVIYNLEVFKKGFPIFMEMSNHKAILAGQNIVIDAVVPHIPDWDQWVDRCDMEYEKIEKKVYDILFPYFQEVHQEWVDTDYYPEGLEPLKWDFVRPYRHRKDKPLPEGWPKKAKWFQIFDKGEIKLKSNDIGVLLQCEYNYQGKWYPVQYSSKLKFHIIYTGKEVKLPNRKNPGENFGNMLGSDALFLATKEEPLLRSTLLPDEIFIKVLKLVDLTTTYVGFRGRVMAQNRKNGIVAAEVKPAGTVSGRTVSPLYNTLPAHWDEPKIMSEIKMTSQCPEGYKFVGGDADQQEASIAAVMADSYYSVSGASSFSKAILAGTKAEGTDYHSITAKNITGKDKVSGDERFSAKAPNFGLIYGAGVKTTAKSIAFGFDYDMDIALQKSRAAVKGFKGEKTGTQKDQIDTIVLPNAAFTGGVASDVFNKMGDMIRQNPPTGLFFNNQWAKSLWPKYCKTDSSPPQLNYCIQASCSTYGFLSAWVISITDEIRRNKIRARFSISVHDEVWFLCHDDDCEKLAFWIMICYARTWALVHHNLGIVDMPVVRAFPSSISIDPILRKSCDAETKTPTFPSYPAGREVSIYDFV